MKNSLLLFCTARFETVNRALTTVLKSLGKKKIIYCGPSNSPFHYPGNQFVTWGSGSFNFWKGLRLRSSWNKIKPQTVVLCLNRADGKGYFMLRLFSQWISKGKTLEVTPEGKIRPLDLRQFVDTYHIEKTFYRIFAAILNIFKPIFKIWLRPQKITIECDPGTTTLHYTTLRDFDTDTNLDASIIIRTFNEEHLLQKTLSAIYNQKGVKFEVILIDSESTDATLKIAGSFPIRLIKIKKESFGYGSSLNLGAQLAKGRNLVNLSAHAIPVHENWLKELTDPLSDPLVAGVHGLEKPMDGHCGLLERKILIDSFPNAPLENADRFFFSNANAALSKQYLIKNPFNENFTWAEDRIWAKHMRNLGFKILYRPKAAVYHSHNLTAKQNFERCYKFFAIQFRMLYENRAVEIRHDFNHSLPSRILEFRRFLSDRNWMTSLPSFFYAPFCEFVNYLGCEYAWEQWYLHQTPKPTIKRQPLLNLIIGR